MHVNSDKARVVGKEKQMETKSLPAFIKIIIIHTSFSNPS
jgi:hypothetical protein